MRASTILGPGQITVGDAPDPDLLPGQVLLKVLQAAICGSDRKSLARGGLSGGRHLGPGAPGHECVGEVLESDSELFRRGDRLLVMPPLDNSFAELISVPPKFCVPVPESLTTPTAIIGQQFGTVLHALRKVGSMLDRSVAIVGQGPAGLLFLHMARMGGARQIVTFERRAARRAASERIGVDLAADPADPEAISAALRLLDGEGADLVIDAAGAQSAINLSYELVRPFGAVLHFGLPTGALQFDHELAFRKQATTYRSVGAQAEQDMACFRLSLKMIERGLLPADDLITHHLPLGRLPEGFALAGDPNGDALKILIDV